MGSGERPGIPQLAHCRGMATSDRELRSYVRRGGRLGPQLRSALAEHLPRYVTPDGMWQREHLFPGCREWVLEIGSGMGEATLELARTSPETGIIAAEVHDRGIAALARGLDERALTNVRIFVGDGRDALRDYLAVDSLDGIRVFFPDPWPKSRHHKRRLLSPETVGLMVGRLRPGGLLHVATDHAGYAEVIGQNLEAEPRLRRVHLGDRPPWRPETKFERAGSQAGRPSIDFCYRRSAESTDDSSGPTTATEPLRR